MKGMKKIGDHRADFDHISQWNIKVTGSCQPYTK
jgi:hypothetical protein